MAKTAVLGVDLHLNEGKYWAQPASGTGPAPAAAGSGETASARRRDSARLIGGALCDLRKSGLQVRQGRAPWADLVSDRYSGTWPHHRRHHPRGESGRSPRLDRELPQGEGSPRKDFRDQPRTAAARARQAAPAQTKGISECTARERHIEPRILSCIYEKARQASSRTPLSGPLFEQGFRFPRQRRDLDRFPDRAGDPAFGRLSRSLSRLCLPAAQLSATGSGIDPARPPAMDRRWPRLP